MSKRPNGKRRSPPPIRRPSTPVVEISIEPPGDLAIELRARWAALAAAIETARGELSVIDGLQADAAKANREHEGAGRSDLRINLSALRREVLGASPRAAGPRTGASRGCIRADRLLQAVMAGSTGRPGRKRLLGNGG